MTLQKFLEGKEFYHYNIIKTIFGEVQFMKKLFRCADLFIQKCNWKDFALVKICLCAMGLWIGVNAPKEKKKSLCVAAGTMFFLTYIPLMMKFGKVLKDHWND